MQVNAALLVLLLEFFVIRKIYSVPFHFVKKGVAINDLIKYYEPAMYTPQEILNFHSRRRRNVNVPFSKPLKISFKALDRQFNLILRTDDRIFTNDVVFDSTFRTLLYDTKKVYTGILEGEEDSLVQGIITREGLFDGTIFSQNQIFHVEPVSRYKPSNSEHQNTTLLRNHVHTIIYKNSDVKIPPSLKSTCASHSLYLSRLNNSRETKKSAKQSAFKSGYHFNKEWSSLWFDVTGTHHMLSGKPVIWHHEKRTTKNDVPSPLAVENRRIKLSKSLTLDNDALTSKKRNKSRSLNVLKRNRDIKILNNKNDNSVINNMIENSKINLAKSESKTVQHIQKFNVYQSSEETTSSRTLKHVSKRATIDPKKTTCMLYLQADHLFYQKYGTEEACIEVMTRHVQRVNAIYKTTDFNQDGKSDNISFMIKRIKVHTSESSKDPSYRFPGNYGVEKFLELFSEEDYDAFCLAYMFTYRDFEMGTLGLAWTGDLKNAGGVCEKNGHYRGSLKSLNTGIVTLLNYGKHVPPAVSHVTLAHEIGHNFGSPHDPESCTPGGEDGNYIMFARATSGDKKNNNKFSPCSLNSINPVLNSKARSQVGCFTEPQMAICGNGVVEVGEDCDCGWEEDCRDSCCYPQRRYSPPGETPCKLTPNSVCSPSQGPCCTSECQLKFGDKCRDDNGCRDSSYCDGRSPSCPPSNNKPNKTICNDEFVCFMGECTGSICLAYGLESCQCIPGPKDSTTKACELCCKKPGDDQPCISSFDWNESPYDVPDMFSKPGTPCNNYNGYCDVFQKCREVDPSGPLATLRKLLLSEESLASFKRWVTEHWYAVVVIVISIIFLLVLSTKLLGKHQNVKLKSITIIHSATTETVRLPSDGEAGLTIHPPAVRTKLPLHRKVREKKLHTKVLVKKKNKSRKAETAGELDKLKAIGQKKSMNAEEQNKIEPTEALPGESLFGKVKESKTEVPSVENPAKNNKDKVLNRESRKEAHRYMKQKSVEKVSEPVMTEISAKTAATNDFKAQFTDDITKASSKIDSLKLVSPPDAERLYSKVDNNQQGCQDGEMFQEKTNNRRTSHSNRVSLEANETSNVVKDDHKYKGKSKNTSKLLSKKQAQSKTSPKKKRVKKEVIQYNNDESQAKTTDIPVEDPLGKVQNWLMHSISTGKTSENFGIMTLTLPKSKSSPVGLCGKISDHQLKANNPPKIVHKSDKIIHIPKLSQKRSRSTGNLRKPDKKDEKVKVQVVYKPPFKFSVKLRKNRVLGTVGTTMLDEKGHHLNRKPVGITYEKIQRTAILVRSKQKQEKRTKQIPQGRKTPDKENSTENPFTFPSGVAPMTVSSVNQKQIPIYLTDQVDIESNVHTVPSDLDVLLSESKFLFSDA